MVKSFKRLVLVGFLFTYTGCGSSFNERHFFREEDGSGKPLNYYRVSVDGWTLMSSSRYLSGYYSDSALDTYFAEFTQPPGGRIGGPGNDTDKSTQSATVVPLTGEDNSSLVVILSSNSDQIAMGLKALMQSESVGKTLERIVRRDRIQSAVKASSGRTVMDAESKALVGVGDKLIDTDAFSSDADGAQANALLFVNQLASFLEPGRHFSDLAVAKQWLEQNASRLSGGAK